VLESAPICEEVICPICVVVSAWTAVLERARTWAAVSSETDMAVFLAIGSPGAMPAAACRVSQEKLDDP
jgi:hypothetical protein